MRIPSTVKRADSVAAGVLRNWIQARNLRPAYILLFIFLIFASGFSLGAFHSIGRTAAFELNKIRILDPKMTVINYFKGRFSKPEKLYLDIKYKDLQHLLFKQQQALQRGYILTEDDSYVPGKLTAEGRQVSADIRLKGDYLDHVEDKKISLRIKIKKNRKLFGMSRFSIQSPKRSGWIKEWIFHRFLKHEGLIGLRYSFINVFINGNDLGIFALEESFSKELIESNFRREGSILKFDESALTNTTLTNKGDARDQADHYYAADIISFRTRKIFNDEEMKSQFLHARNKLEMFRGGKAGVAETFDLRKTARLFAVVDLLGATHALRWKNVRFYYNPVTDKLELIAYNAYSYDYDYPEISRLWIQDYMNNGYVVREWLDRFFKDPVFNNLYLKELERLTRNGYLEKFFDDIHNELMEMQDIIYKDGPLLDPPVAGLFKIRNTISQVLHPRRKLKVYLTGQRDNGLELLIANTTFMPVELAYIECTSLNKKFYGLSIREFHAKKADTPLDYLILRVNDFSSEDTQCLQNQVRDGDNVYASNLKLLYRIRGIDRVYSANVNVNPIKFTDDIVPSPEQITKFLALCEERGILTVDQKHGEIHINPGDWKIDSALIFPSGFRVTGGAGTRINLEGHAAIISYSPLELRGTTEQPFILDSDDRTGQGIVVLQAGAGSILSDVVIRNQTSLARADWKLTGAVTFYESEVSIKNSVFEKNHSEDMLNLVRSKFNIISSKFDSGDSDAVDVDFGNGTIEQSQFKNCRNDCIDFSGSAVNLDRIIIDGGGDKGVSVGENSRIRIVDSKITKSNIAFASKDDSVLDVKNTQIETVKIAFAAYNKKQEFSGGSMNVENYVLSDVGKVYIRDQPSSIVLDGENMEANIDRYVY